MSNQPFHIKFNTALNLKERWLKVSDPRFHLELTLELKHILASNGYSKEFINKVFNYQHVNVNNNNRDRKFFALPYISQSSLIIQKILKKLDPNFVFAFKNHNTLQNLIFSKTKDITPALERSGVVYCVPCLDCPKVYVGESMQHLRCRIYQHKYDVNKGNSNTGLATHAKDENHHFSFNNIKILAYEENCKKRKIREILEILKLNNTVNFK